MPDLIDYSCPEWVVGPHPVHFDGAVNQARSTHG